MSDTPETDKLFAPMWLLEGPPTDAQLYEANKSHKRLERQRDAYAETLRDIAKVGHDWERNYIRERHPELASGSGEGSSA